MERELRRRLQSAELDHDAVNVIVKTGKRADVPPDLADRWAASWDGQALLDLMMMSPADRQHALARIVDHFLQSPVNRLLRAAYAAAQTRDADLRLAGDLALDLRDVLTAFGRDITVATTSPFTGKVKYLPLTDVDVASAAALIEVSTQHDASGKVSQLAELMSAEVNPHDLPVFHLLPNVKLNSTSAQALRAAGSAGVYNTGAALAAAVRAIPRTNP